jgi:hypothetical protein
MLTNFRTSFPSEWGQAPDLRAAAAEAHERSIWLRERAQAQEAQITAALGNPRGNGRESWWAVEISAAPTPGGPLERVPAVHVLLLAAAHGYEPGHVLCRRWTGAAPYVIRRPDPRCDGNAEAYDPEITCKACLKALARLTPPHGHHEQR